MKSGIFIVIALTFAWVILSENFSPASIAIGIFVSATCLFFSRKYLPANERGNFNVFWLILYPFYLIGQIYLSAFTVIKAIFTGVKVDVIEVDTKLTNMFLKNVLAMSITLTPGSILLDLKGEKITALRLRGINDANKGMENAGDLLKGKLEKALLKIQR